jgi:tetratricopeptide (TPR) repeat protein
MPELLRKRIERELVCEIANVDSVQLEIIGHKVIQCLENKDLVHHGINKDFKPVKATVDTFSQDFTVVGEYSTLQGYFQAASQGENKNYYDKIEKDIQHAVNIVTGNTPSVIYLISNQEEPPSFRTKFGETDVWRKYRSILKLLDSRELAKHIYDQSLKNSQLAAFFGYYLPDFNQNLNRYEYYGRVPPVCSHFHSEELMLHAIQQHYKNGANICILHGISGSGKTMAAVDYVNTYIHEIGNYLWINGEDWKEDLPLTAVKRSRGGSAINVAGVFNSIRTILVIDDIKRSISDHMFSDLTHGFELGGRILITSQFGEPSNPMYLQIPYISEDTGYMILGENKDDASDAAHQFIKRCIFCPLILSVTRQIIEIDDLDRDSIYCEVVENPQVTHMQNGEQVMSRILGQISSINQEALRKIASSGCTSYDSKFISRFIGSNVRVALQRLSLLNRDATSSTVIIHDLICSAIWNEKIDGTDLANEVERYICSHNGEMVPSVLRQIHLSADQLLAAHRSRGERNPDWLMYGILQLAEYPLRAELISALLDREIRSTSAIVEVLCIVDSKEAHSYSLSQEDRTNFYISCAEMYGIIAGATCHPDVRAELLHHRGKALRRSGRLKDARDCFQQLVAERPHWHATYGQIAHIGVQKQASKDDKEAGERAIRHIIDQIMADIYAVPLRVSLALLSRLRSYPLVTSELVGNEVHIKQLAQVVALSALEGFDQFYEAFVAFTSLFGFHHRHICLSIAEMAPDMVAIFPDTVDRSQWVNACEALTNIASAAALNNQAKFSASLYKAAEVFAEKLSRQQHLNQYELRAAAKAFIAVGNPSTALEIIDKIQDNAKEHWVLYQQGKAELAISTSASLTTAARALELAINDPRASTRLSSYYELLSDCQQAHTSIREALDSINKAITHASDSKYRDHLLSKKEMLLAMIKPS